MLARSKAPRHSFRTSRCSNLNDNKLPPRPEEFPEGSWTLEVLSVRTSIVRTNLINGITYRIMNLKRKTVYEFRHHPKENLRIFVWMSERGAGFLQLLTTNIWGASLQEFPWRIANNNFLTTHKFYWETKAQAHPLIKSDQITHIPKWTCSAVWR